MIRREVGELTFRRMEFYPRRRVGYIAVDPRDSIFFTRTLNRTNQERNESRM